MTPGQVVISNHSYQVNMWPQLSKYGLIVCNFRADEKAHRIYKEEGPHVRVLVPAKDLLSQLKIGETVAITPVSAMGLGDIEMLHGYPAADCGHGSRRMSSLTVSTSRRPSATKFFLAGAASEPLDPTTTTGSRLELGPVSFSLEFDVSDDGISDFLPELCEREMFLSLINVA